MIFTRKSSPNIFWAIAENDSFVRFTKSNGLMSLVLTILYFLWFNLVIPFRPEHLILYIIVLTLYYFNGYTRSFLKAMLPFIIFWMIYDSMRVVPNYEVNKVHIKEPYLLDKALFGVFDNGQLITLNEFFSKYHTTFFDVLSGLFYINWVPIPLFFGAYLFFNDKHLIYSFSYSFLLVNLIGFVVYYAYPAAPPWYVAEYGFVEHFNIMGNVGNLKHFDEIIGTPIFKGLYEKNANVFAAMPSLHSAYPLIVLYFSIKKKIGYFTIFFAFFCFGIWGSAIYSNHHYVIDVLAGILCAIVGLTVFEVFVKCPLIKFIVPL